MQRLSFRTIWEWIGHGNSHYIHKQYDSIIFVFQYIKKSALGKTGRSK